MSKQARLFVGFAVIVILMLVALLDSLSRGSSDPVIATALNPLNADARVRRATLELERKNPPPSLDEAQLQLDRARFFSPLDARIYGLTGEVALRRQEPQRARSAFEAGLRVSAAELYSLRRMIVLDLQAGDGDAVLRNLDVFLKRWPGRFNDVGNVFPILMRSDAGYRSVLASAREGPEWRGRLLMFLASREDLAPLAYRVVLDLRKGAAPLVDAEVDQVVAYLFSRGQHRLAYQAFALLQIERGLGDDLGFVTNPTFSAQPGRAPFQWSLPGAAGAEARMFADDAPGLRVSFRDKVVRGVLARQTTMLPPGPKTLTFVSTAANLKVPKGLSWTVKCLTGSTVLAEAQIEPGSYKDMNTMARFVVPEQSCESQELALSTGVVTISMRYRYDGDLTVKKLEIENAEN